MIRISDQAEGDNPVRRVVIKIGVGLIIIIGLGFITSEIARPIEEAGEATAPISAP